MVSNTPATKKGISKRRDHNLRTAVSGMLGKQRSFMGSLDETTKDADRRGQERSRALLHTLPRPDRTLTAGEYAADRNFDHRYAPLSIRVGNRIFEQLCETVPNTADRQFFHDGLTAYMQIEAKA